MNNAKNFSLAGINASQVAALLVNVISVANMILLAFGIKAIPVTSDQIYILVSGVFAIAALVYGLWKNFNVTTAAQKGQQMTDIIKQGVITYEEADAIFKEIWNQYGSGFKEENTENTSDTESNTADAESTETIPETTPEEDSES